jgi:hypothetical protein
MKRVDKQTALVWLFAIAFSAAVWFSIAKAAVGQWWVTPFIVDPYATFDPDVREQLLEADKALAEAQQTITEWLTRYDEFEPEVRELLLETDALLGQVAEAIDKWLRYLDEIEEREKQSQP